MQAHQPGSLSHDKRNFEKHVKLRIEYIGGTEMYFSFLEH